MRTRFLTASLGAALAVLLITAAFGGFPGPQGESGGGVGATPNFDQVLAVNNVANHNVLLNDGKVISGSGSNVAVVVKNAPGGSLQVLTSSSVNALNVGDDGGTTLGGATGGSKGSGTVNATGLYVNGASVGAGFNPTPIKTDYISGLHPNGIVSDGTYLWVSDEANNVVAVLDPVKRLLVKTVAVGTTPQGMCYDGTYVWVANYGSANVTQITASTQVVANTVTVGTNPIGCSCDSTYVWVSNYGAGTVSQITISTHSVANTVTVGANPYFSADDGTYVWVPNFGGNTVSQISISSHAVANTVTVGTGPSAAVSDGTYVWVANYTSGTISQITASTHTVANTITVGANPTGICFDGTYVWSCMGAGSNYPSGCTVWQILPSTHAAVNAIPVYQVPIGISYALQDVCFDPASGAVWSCEYTTGLVFPFFTR